MSNVNIELDRIISKLIVPFDNCEIEEIHNNFIVEYLAETSHIDMESSERLLYFAEKMFERLAFFDWPSLDRIYQRYIACKGLTLALHHSRIRAAFVSFDFADTWLEETNEVSEKKKAKLKLVEGSARAVIQSLDALSKDRYDNHGIAEKDFWCYYGIAEFYLEKDLAKSEKYLRRALKIDCEYIKARLYLGHVLRLEGKFNMALANYESVENSKVTDKVRFNILQLKALCFIYLKEPDRAKHCLNKVAEKALNCKSMLELVEKLGAIEIFRKIVDSKVKDEELERKLKLIMSMEGCPSSSQ